MAKYTCDKCSKKFISHNFLLEHDYGCHKKIKYHAKHVKPIVPFAQKDFYRVFV